MSLWIAKEALADSPAPEFLVISDNGSVLDRCNEEKNWVELYLTRPIPMGKSRQLTQLIGLMSGVHSNWAYKQLEASVDGIVDFKLEEEGKDSRDLIRIRSMRSVYFDREWHKLNIGRNFEATLEK